ncbi:hypothetical protein ACOMHN_016775 [Nucella lapillus]
MATALNTAVTEHGSLCTSPARPSVSSLTATHTTTATSLHVGYTPSLTAAHTTTATLLHVGYTPSLTAAHTTTAIPLHVGYTPSLTAAHTTTATPLHVGYTPPLTAAHTTTATPLRAGCTQQLTSPTENNIPDKQSEDPHQRDIDPTVTARQRQDKTLIALPTDRNGASPVQVFYTLPVCVCVSLCPAGPVVAATGKRPHRSTVPQC